MFLFQKQDTEREIGCRLHRLPSEDEAGADRQNVLHSLPLSVCSHIKISSALIFSPELCSYLLLTGSNRTTGPFTLAEEVSEDLGG